MNGARPAILALLVSLLLPLLLVAGAEGVYTVQPGDSLSRIAQRHGVTVAALQRQNGLTGTLIRPGQRLTVPGAAAPADPRATLRPAPDLPPGFGLHRLEAGESLVAVATRYGLSETALLAVNADLVTNGVPTASYLRVPPRPGLLVRTEESSDVLTLALAYGMAPSDLQRANGLSAPTVPAGRWIFVPGVLAPRPESRPGQEAAVTPASPRERDRLAEQLLAELQRAPQRLAGYRPSERAGAFRWPLARRGVVSSSFGPRALSVAGSTFHTGLDIAVPVGTPILAVAPGVVTRAGWGGNYGYVVFVDHGGGMQTRYAHMSRIDVRPGERVQGGSPLGLVGETGSTTGPHLHFELRLGGRAVDPRGYLP